MEPGNGILAKVTEKSNARLACPKILHALPRIIPAPAPLACLASAANGVQGIC